MSVTLEKLFASKVHLGHLRRFREPKMAPFTFNSKNVHLKTQLIDLDQTQKYLQKAYDFVKNLASRPGSKILFVGTKRIAQPIIKEQAIRANMPYVDQYWLGGTLTNYRTIRDSVKRLKSIITTRQSQKVEQMTKKEIRHLERKQIKLERGVGGITEMSGLPDALFIIDIGHEHIAVSEARKLKIPVIGVVDTNNSPEGIDYLIPGNDDAISAVTLYATLIADAVLEGTQFIVDREKVDAAPQPVIKKVKRVLDKISSSISNTVTTIQESVASPINETIPTPIKEDTTDRFDISEEHSFNSEEENLDKKVQTVFANTTDDEILNTVHAQEIEQNIADITVHTNQDEKLAEVVEATETTTGQDIVEDEDRSHDLEETVHENSLIESPIYTEQMQNNDTESGEEKI